MKKIFKKIFRGIKKVFRPIGRELKKGLKGIGKFFGKLGPIGTLALSLMLPGIGSALTSFGAWAGVGTGAAAPFSGTIFGPLGKVIQGVARVGSKVGQVYNSVSSFVGDTIKAIPGVGDAYKGFSNWVSTKMDNTRRMFGLETSMDTKGFEAALSDNAKAVENLTDVNATFTPKEIAQPIDSIKDMQGAETSIKSSRLSDEELFAQAEKQSLLAEPPTTKTNLEMFPERETIEVPIGYEVKTNETLKPFSTKKNPFNQYELKTKTVFKDELTPEKLDLVNVDDTTYFTNFENSRVARVEKYYNELDKEAQAELLKNPKGLERVVVGQDVAALGKPAAVVGSILAPDEPEDTGTSGGYVQPLPTDTDVRNYTDSVAGTYAALGYKGDNSLNGYAMFGGYGNTPFNFMQTYARPVTQPVMTTPMPSF